MCAAGDQTSGNADAAMATSMSNDPLVTEIKRHKRGAALAVAILIIAITGVAFALNRLVSHPRSASGKSFREIKITKLTNNGKTRDAAISPDGKYVAYFVDNEGAYLPKLLPGFASASRPT